MLDREMLEYYLKAGRIASAVRRKVRGIIKEGTPILEICETVEGSIRRMGGEPAFPCNVCVNNIAAHYSSPPKDSKTIQKDAIVKVDLGVQVEGYIADTATTISLSPQYENMVYAVNDALEQAIKIIQPKTKISEIGNTIQKTIEKYGFKPIQNLSGHQMCRYVLHTGKSIPNIPTSRLQSLNEDEVYAIEPFLTLASSMGLVKNSSDAYIYRFQKERRLSNSDAEKLLTTIKSNFRTLPFSLRWIRGLEEKNIREAFYELKGKKCISSYPVLFEPNNTIVAQAEHTVIVSREGCLVTTR